MNTIRVKGIIKSTPQNWADKHGIRVFFDHEEKIFDEFVNRNSRPVKDYHRIIRESIIPELIKGLEYHADFLKYRVVPVINQHPIMHNINIEWLPRTAYCVRLPLDRIKSRYAIDYEIIIMVETI